MLIEKIILGPLFLAISVMLFVLAYQLRRGKGLKWLAGNWDEHIPLDKAKKIGKSTGILCYLSSICSMYLFIDLLFYM